MSCRGFLNPGPVHAILVSMTRISKTPVKTASAPGRWPLQDAKARFSELVRRARSEGPQHVTLHGREEVVVISAEAFRRLSGGQMGDTLIAVLGAAPHQDLSLEPARAPMPVREVDL